MKQNIYWTSPAMQKKIQEEAASTLKHWDDREVPHDDRRSRIEGNQNMGISH